MRYITGVLRPVEEMHPVERALAEEPAVDPVAVHQLKLLDDGTCIVLLQVRDEQGRLRDVLSGLPAVREYAVAGERDRYVYLESDAHELSTALLNLRADADLVVRMPMRHTGDGGLRGTVVGDDAAFQRAVDALPEEIDLEVEAIGDYRPDAHHWFDTLTGRQQEILRTAVREGYYEDPRRATQRDVAEALGIGPGTVSEHLRRIEAKVFSEFDPGTDDRT